MLSKGCNITEVYVRLDSQLDRSFIIISFIIISNENLKSNQSKASKLFSFQVVD